MSAYKYDGFISYSTRADGDLAPKIQEGLERLAKPWNKRRALKIFQDVDDLAASSDLESTLRRELEQSDTLVYLASEEAAASQWCSDELEYWLDVRPTRQLVVVLTNGTLEFDKDREHPTAFERSTSAPAAFAKLTTVPLYIDMRMDDRDVELLDYRRSPDFRAKLTKIAAAVHSNKTGRQVEPRDIDSADLAEHRKASRLRGIAVTLLVILTVVAIVAGLVANQQRITAQGLARSAESRALAASSRAVLDRDPELASLLALEAADTELTAEAGAALRAAEASPWRSTLADTDVFSIALDLDGGRALVGGLDGAVLRDVQTAADIATFPGPSSIATMNSDASSIVTGDFSGVTIWDGDGTERRRLPVTSVRSVEFSRDGSLIVVAGGDDVTVWNVGGGDSTVVSGGGVPIAGAQGASFNHDATRLVLFGDSSDPIVVDVDGTLGVVALTPDDLADDDGLESNDRTTSARFSRDGSRIVTAKGTQIRVWDTEGRRLDTFSTGDAVRNQAGLVLNSVESVAYDDQDRIIAAGFAGTFLIDGGDGVARTISTEPATAAELSGDASIIATTGFGNGALDAGVRFWDIDGPVLVDLPVDPFFLDGGEMAATVSADGARVSAVARLNSLGEVRVWDLDGTILRQQNSPEAQSSVLNSDGSKLITDEGQFGVSMTSLDDGAEPSTLTRDQSGLPVFDRMGETLAIPTFGGLELWDFTGAEANRVEVIESIAKVERVALDPTGEHVVTSSFVDGVVLWRSDGERVAVLDPDGAWSLAFSPDGTLVAVAGNEGVRVWDVVDAARSTAIQSEDASAVDFSQDGLYVVTASSFGVSVFDLQGNRVATLTTAGSSSAVFSADGSVIVTAGESGVQAWRWRADGELEDELTRRVGGRQFTTAECELYRIDRCPPEG